MEIQVGQIFDGVSLRRCARFVHGGHGKACGVGGFELTYSESSITRVASRGVPRWASEVSNTMGSVLLAPASLQVNTAEKRRARPGAPGRPRRSGARWRLRRTCARRMRRRRPAWRGAGFQRNGVAIGVFDAVQDALADFVDRLFQAVFVAQEYGRLLQRHALEVAFDVGRASVFPCDRVVFSQVLPPGHAVEQRASRSKIAPSIKSGALGLRSESTKRARGKPTGSSAFGWFTGSFRRVAFGRRPRLFCTARPAAARRRKPPVRRRYRAA